MVNSRAIFVFLASFSMLPVSAVVSAQAAEKPKLSASAIRIAMVEGGDIPIPAEFRFAVYERLVGRMTASGAFQKVYRAGDRAADGVSDLVTLHTKVEAYKASERRNHPRAHHRIWRHQCGSHGLCHRSRRARAHDR